MSTLVVVVIVFLFIVILAALFYAPPAPYGSTGKIIGAIAALVLFLVALNVIHL